MKISRKKLAQIIKEEIMSVINEQRPPDRYDGDVDGSYTDEEREQLDPIKPSHKNFGFKGPTRLRAVAKELIEASNNYTAELKRFQYSIESRDLKHRDPRSDKFVALLKAEMELHSAVTKRIARVLKLQGALPRGQRAF